VNGEGSLSDTEKEFAAFLGRDVSECFAQMRHYDGQIIEICKFAFGAYTAAIGGALALYKYGQESDFDYRTAAAASLGVAWLLGSVMFSLVVRNRVYFVVLARYVNSHRRFFLSQQPLGFSNETQMYDDPNLPPFFNWRSSQSFQFYILALLNSVLVGLLVLFLTNGVCLFYTLGSGVGLLIVQLAWAITYLRRREEKSAAHALGAPR
jgi:hypothetical protein